MVNERDVVELARRFVAVETIAAQAGHGEIDATLVARDILEQAGFTCWIDEYDPENPKKVSLVARLHPEAGNSCLCLAGHLDVVPLGTAPWRDDPFSAKIVEMPGGPALYGRGSCDMKSGAAAVVCAAVKMAPKLNGQDLVVHLYGGEEVGCQGSTHVMQTPGFRNGIGATVICEPTSNRPLVGHKGTLWLKLSTKGRTAHGSLPEKGDNALTKLLPSACALIGYRPAGVHPVLGQNTCLVSTLHAGINCNSVPDQSALTLDLRLVPGTESDAVVEEIRQRIAPVVQIERLLDLKPVWTDPELPWVRSVLASLSEMRGCSVQPEVMTGFTDAAALRRVMPDLPVIIMGPGSTAVAHTTDEFCPVAEIREAQCICERLIEDWYFNE